MSNTFKGLPVELFEFLQELADNNNRDWFTANKPRYKEIVVEPICDFIDALRPQIQQVSTSFVVDSRPHGGSMFRIYRDTRFSKDKTPYKEHVGCQFRHIAGKDAHAPGFYVHISPMEIFFGGGVWRPPNPVLDKVRNTIVDNPERWANIIGNKTFKRRFGGIRGDGLKRPPRGYSADHPHIVDLKRKSFFALQEVSPDLATSGKLVTEVGRAFTAVSPMMEFITRSLELPYTRR